MKLPLCKNSPCPLPCLGSAKCRWTFELANILRRMRSQSIGNTGLDLKQVTGPRKKKAMESPKKWKQLEPTIPRADANRRQLPAVSVHCVQYERLPLLPIPSGMSKDYYLPARMRKRYSALTNTASLGGYPEDLVLFSMHPKTSFFWAR